MANGAARRTFLKEVFGAVGAGMVAGPVVLDTVGHQSATQAPRGQGAGTARGTPAPASPEPQRLEGSIRITKLETLLVKPRWLFLKIHTDEGIVGLGEPITEGRALTCAEAVKEIEPYLVGKDARRVAHHWQAIYRHAFYRGGPILTSALSGIDQALWDIKGKALKVPVYELFGGPTRDRVRIYAHARTIDQVKQRKAEGFTAFKTGPALMRRRSRRQRRLVALHRITQLREACRRRLREAA